MLKFGDDKNIYSERAPLVLKILDDELNYLTIYVATTVISDVKETMVPSGIEVLDNILSDTCSILPDEDMIYEITFERYIMYQMRNESFVSRDEYEIRNGQFFVIYERSRLLEYLLTITDCQQLSDGTYYPDEWKHYGIIAQNHIIDVISVEPPVVKRIK